MTDDQSGPSLGPTADTQPGWRQSGKWKTDYEYQMRRIYPVRNRNGQLIGFRPMIQRGRGPNRQTFSEVFRITPAVDEHMALSMAQRWRDQKEHELGLAGRLTKNAAKRFLSGISLVVTTHQPRRAYWKWSDGDCRITSYMGKRKDYLAAYVDLLVKVCKVIGCDVPENPIPPSPRPDQRERLEEMGIGGWPKPDPEGALRTS